MTLSAPAAARRYARALLDVAAAKGDPGVQRDELQELASLLAARHEILNTLTHPGLAGERRLVLVRALFANRVSPLTLRLLTLLAENGRLDLLAAVARAFVRALNEQRGVVSAEVVSAQPLDAAQTAALEAALAQATRRSVELSARVDAELLGGLVVTMDGRTYDGSVRTRLQGLRRRLRGQAA